jgi:hypothetical protein
VSEPSAHCANAISTVEAAGYGARIASAADTTARTVYIVQFCLIILAPVLMAGVIYLVFGRIVFHVVPAEARTFRLLWVPGMSGYILYTKPQER